MEHKERGNALFEQGDLEGACAAYLSALEALDEAAEPEQRATVLSNRSAALLKLQRFSEAEQDAGKALELHPGAVKALYRRAQALAAQNKLERALVDLRRLLQLDPSNTAAASLLQKLRHAAQDMNSTTTQALKALDEAASESDAGSRSKKLRQLLGSILEDDQLAASIAHHGACEKLWALRDYDATALKLLSKMSEYKSCYKKVLAAIDFADTQRIIQMPAEEVLKIGAGGKASCLNLLWRLFAQEEEVEEASSSIDISALLELVVDGISSDDESLRRVGVEATVRLCADNKDRSAKFFELRGLEALMSMIAREYNRDEPLQQVSVVLGQVLPSLKDDDAIKGHALKFCKPLLLSKDVHEQIKGVAGLDAIYYANKELGLALIQEEKLLEPLTLIARHGSTRAQALAADVFGHMANSETGRALLAGEVTDVLKLLATADSGPVRSAAAVTLTKLNAIDFDAESESGVFVLSSVASLLTPKATTEEHAKGVEAVSFVISDTQVKMMLMKGDGLKVMDELIGLAEIGAKEPFAYGLAFILENLTMSEDDKRREKLREMEVTEEQWDQFEKLTKSSTRKPGQQDPVEQVAFRIETLVNLNAISALRSLVLNGSDSERVLESAAKAFCNMASVQQVRSAMLTQGALKALFKLSATGTAKTKHFAGHALGKIFITTNPNVLKDAQLMDTIGPLVREVRHSDSDLCIFECCMALTNIATVSWETKHKIVTSKGIPALEYAQYSDNLRVRRAATEAINNLVPADEIMEWFCKPEKLKLWLMFALSYEEDPGTSSAATGALANISWDAKIAEALAKQEDDRTMKTLMELAACENIDIVHRAVVCLRGLIETWPDGKGAEVISASGGEQILKEVLRKFPSSPATEPTKETLKLLLETSFERQKNQCVEVISETNGTPSDAEAP